MSASRGCRWSTRRMLRRPSSAPCSSEPASSPQSRPSRAARSRRFGRGRRSTRGQYTGSVAAQSTRLIPLGGLGEVGKNMLVVESDNGIVVIDAGLSFPRDEHLGVDLVLPDFSYLR